MFAIAPRGIVYAWGGGGSKPLNTFLRNYRMPLTAHAPAEITYKNTKFDLKALGIKAEWLPESDDEAERKSDTENDDVATDTTDGGSSVSTLTEDEELAELTTTGMGTSTLPGSPSALAARRKAKALTLPTSIMASTHALSSAVAMSVDDLSMLARKARKRRERSVEDAKAHADRKERKRIRKKRRLRRARRELEAKANRKVVYRLADLPPDLDNDARAEE